MMINSEVTSNLKTRENLRIDKMNEVVQALHAGARRVMK